jgi:hypothetical protein
MTTLAEIAYADIDDLSAAELELLSADEQGRRFADSHRLSAGGSSCPGVCWRAGCCKGRPVHRPQATEL